MLTNMQSHFQLPTKINQNGEIMCAYGTCRKHKRLRNGTCYMHQGSSKSSPESSSEPLPEKMAWHHLTNTRLLPTQHIYFTDTSVQGAISVSAWFRWLSTPNKHNIQHSVYFDHRTPHEGEEQAIISALNEFYAKNLSQEHKVYILTDSRYCINNTSDELCRVINQIGSQRVFIFLIKGHQRKIQTDPHNWAYIANAEVDSFAGSMRRFQESLMRKAIRNPSKKNKVVYASRNPSIRL